MKILCALVFILVSGAVSAFELPFHSRLAEDIARSSKTKSSHAHRDQWKDQPIKLIKIQELWKGSNEEGFTYLDQDQRSTYKLIYKNGLLHDAKGNIFDTRRAGSDSAMYVMLEDGTTYASLIRVQGEFEHHSLVGEEDVLCAGKMVVHNGEIVTINDFSPQYISYGIYSLTKVITQLRNNKVPTNNTRVVYKHN